MAVALQRYHHHQQASDVMGYAMGEESMYAQDQALAQASAPASTAGDENTGAMPDSSIPLGYRQNAPKTDQQDAAAEHAKQPAQQLTSEEVIELTAFARGKAKIEEQIALLEEIKEIDAFEGFESMEGGSAAIAKAEEVCPYTREDVEQWQQAREAMERDADAFQAHDMSKLRSLATKSVSRPMSPQDTDLVELALKTLYSLDKLLILLRSRQSYLDVLAVRAEWEQRRSISWAQYYALQREVHELVRTKAQWLGHAEVAEHTFREGSQGSINDPSTDDTSLLASSSSTDVIKKTSSALTGHSPQKTSSKAKRSLTASLALGEVLQLEIAKMRSKIALWSDTAVAAAGRAMDAIIDHCQVPDALLDEQDRLENFVEEMKQKLNFLLALGEQWRRSDHLLGKLRELNRNARMLVMSMEEAETPDMQQVHLMEQKCATLREALVAICGDNATKFLDDSTQSSRTLTFLPSLAPPLALHPSFPTQREANDEVMQFLQRELTAAAKKTRQACRDVQQCAEAQRALDVFDARIAPLRALTARCEAVRTRIAALQMSLSEAAATADLSDVWKDVPGWQHDVVSCQSQVTEMRTAGAKAVQELSSQRALCVECGLSSTWLAKREDGCERELETALQKLDAELRDVSSLCVQAAAIDSGVSVSREISETLGTVCDRFDHLAHQPLDLPASSQAMSLRSRLLHELQQELDTGNRARNARLRVQTEVISSQLEAPAHAVTTRLQTLDDALKQASQRLRWEEARLRQASQVGELNDKAEERQQEAIQVLARLEIGAPEAHSYSADVDCICLDLASFVSGIASKTDIVGKAPALPAVANHANVVPPDPDYLARRFLNDICAKLTALRVRIMEKHAAMSAVTPEGTAPPPHRTDARDTSSSIPPDASVVRGDQLANEKPSIAAGNRLPALVDKGLSPLRVSASNTPSKLSSSTRAAKSAAPESEKVAALLDNLHRDPRLAVKSDIPSIEDAAEADRQHSELERQARAMLLCKDLSSSERFSLNKVLLDRTDRVRRLQSLASFGLAAQQSQEVIERCEAALQRYESAPALSTYEHATKVEEVRTAYEAAANALSGLQGNKVARGRLENLKILHDLVLQRTAELKDRAACISASPQHMPRRAQQPASKRSAKLTEPMKHSEKDSPPERFTFMPTPIIIEPPTPELGAEQCETSEHNEPGAMQSYVNVENDIPPLLVKFSIPPSSPQPSLRQTPSPALTGNSVFTCSSSPLARLPGKSSVQHWHTPSRLTSTSSKGSRRSSRASTPSRGSPIPMHSIPRRINHYKANPRSKLDMAVGKVVNQLPVSVTMRIATEDDFDTASRGWHDETGHYLLSDPAQPHVEPRLVFCRILRSGQTMCRIGGGWQELGSFITQRFAGDVDIHQAYAPYKSSRSVSSSSRDAAIDTASDMPTSTSMLLTPTSATPSRRVASDSMRSPTPDRSSSPTIVMNRSVIRTPTPKPGSRISHKHTSSTRIPSDSKIPFPSVTPTKAPRVTAIRP